MDATDKVRLFVFGLALVALIGFAIDRATLRDSPSMPEQGTVIVLAGKTLQSETAVGSSPDLASKQAAQIQITVKPHKGGKATGKPVDQGRIELPIIKANNSGK